MPVIKHMSVLNWARVFAIFLLVGLLLPTGSAFAGTPTPPPNTFEKHKPVVVPTNQNLGEGANVTSLAGGNLIQDPSFEFFSGDWSSFSSSFGTPLCGSTAPYPNGCGNGGGTAGPHSGSAWVWFGGTDQFEDAIVSQQVAFPMGCGVTLQFYLWIGYAGAGSNTSDRFEVFVDQVGLPKFSANATQISSYSTYKLVTINLSSYTDGNVHSIDFLSNTTSQIVNFNLDDVSLVSNCADVNVGVGGVFKGNYTLAPNQSQRISYAGLDNGPVKIQNMNGANIVASERVAYSPDGGTTWTSYSELMGLPVNQLATSYAFPWYNNLDLNSQLRFGNAGRPTPPSP